MKIAIYGYGNLGRGVECAAQYHDGVELVAVFTRRAPEEVKTSLPDTPVYSVDRILEFKDKIDVLILCGGSATDLPKMTPALARDFNVLDSYDTHATIPKHFEAVDAAARESGHTALISAGWDPGLFSIARLYASSVLPSGKDYTFWGRGISQGHSDAIRRIEGVVDARQYTVPIDAALSQVRGGECPEFTAREKHLRECYVVAEAGADKERVEREIKNMPNYFIDYDTTVTFITLDELKKNHGGMPHGGSVIRNGITGFDGENKHTVEFKLSLDSNPEFTASVLVAYARAVDRMAKRGQTGCKTVFDVAPADLSHLSGEELRKTML